MRRLTAVLLSLFLADAALAARNETDPRDKVPYDRLGHAMILQVHRALSDADVAELAKSGILVRRALSGGRYVARVKDEAAARNDARIASVKPMTAATKLQPSVLREAALAKPYSQVNVIFHDDVDFDSARQAILAAGGELDDFLRVRFSPGRRLTVRVPAAALDALGADERVMTMYGPAKKKPVVDNVVSALVSNVNVVNDAPYGLTGEGVTVSLFELAAAQASHVEFRTGNRLNVRALGGTASDASHAMHVAGTIGAAGVRADSKGMAPNAKVEQFCLSIPGQNQCTGDWLDLKDEALAPLGITADNNSWGYELGWFNEDGFPVWDGTAIFYGSYQPEYGGPFVDDISHERKVLFVHSAGNDGNDGKFGTEFSQHRHVDDDGDTITTEIFCYSRDGSGSDCPAYCNGTNPETGVAAGCEKPADRHSEAIPFDTLGVVASAKNVIAVGSLAGIPGNLSSSSTSSRGPAKDGRVKPEVVARGVNVLSTVPTDSYERKGGTSMASPVVTGIAVLLTEQWRKSFAGANPLPEQLKAVILAGADDLGNPGPDYTYGFGLANAKASVDFVRNDAGTGSRIRTFELPQGTGQTREFSMTVAQGQNVRVLLNWADPPFILLGEEGIHDPILINDLDLKVIDPSGATHLPYVLDRVNFNSNATRGVNTIDNTEVVEIANAPAGTYRVIATGTNVAEGPQNAVLVTNATLGAAALPCTDLIDKLRANDTPGTAFGNLSPNAQIGAGICSAGDVDYYKFTASGNGAVTVNVTATDTPLRATLTANGVNVVVDVPANSTRTLTANANATARDFLLRIESNGTLGTAQYTFTTQFHQESQPRRRSSRH
jgi:Subtilase family